MTNQTHTNETTCPKCGADGREADDTTCRQCGLIYAKFKPKAPTSQKQSTADNRFHNLKILAFSYLRKILKYIAWFIAFCLAIAGYGCVDRYMSAKESREIAEKEQNRRQAMTQEQRDAEDKAKIDAAVEKAKQATIATVSQLGREACIAAWKSTLKDPYSAILEEFHGNVSNEGGYMYYATISGRAKNGFGAYMPGNWVCSGKYEAGRITVKTFSAL